MKNFIFTCAIMVASSAALAQKIYAPLPFTTSGTAAPTMTVLVDELKTRGWDVDFKVLNTCGPVKEILENSKTPVLTFWNNNWNSSPQNTCFYDVDENKFIDILRTSWKYLCGPKDNPGFALEKGKTYRVGIVSYNVEVAEKMLTAVADKNEVTFRFVKYESSGRLRTAYESNEVEILYNFSGRKYFNEDNAACFYNNSPESIDGIPSIYTEIEKNTPYDVYNLFAITNGVGLTDDRLSKLKSDIREIVKNNETLNRNLKSSYTDRFEGSIEEQLKFVNEN